ncbi:hypothetical protein EC3006_1939 [Escherichia coli 3006]|nr:hypothetical protein EC3006_1939 [Escherichia coli 3006]
MVIKIDTASTRGTRQRTMCCTSGLRITAFYHLVFFAVS